MGAARGNDGQEPSISAYRRMELSGVRRTSHVRALSENGVAVGSSGAFPQNVPMRWVHGRIDWSDPELTGEATCVSDDGAWLAGWTKDFRGFRKHADEPPEILPLLEGAGDINVMPTGIRSDGTVVGICRSYAGEGASDHAVRWTPEGTIERLLPDTVKSWAFGMNEAGAIVGAYFDAEFGPYHAFLLLRFVALIPNDVAGSRRPLRITIDATHRVAETNETDNLIDAPVPRR
jgi:uncharacterized membrane protein